MPLLCYVLNNTAPRGRLIEVHTQIIEALGALGAHPDSIAHAREGPLPRRVVGADTYSNAAARRGAGARPHWIAGRPARARRGAEEGRPRRPERRAARADCAAAPTAGTHMSATQRIRLVDEVVRRLAAALRAVHAVRAGTSARRTQRQLVCRSAQHHAQLVAVGRRSASSATTSWCRTRPIPRAAENMEKLVRQFRQAGIERIVIDKGVDRQTS